MEDSEGKLIPWAIYEELPEEMRKKIDDVKVISGYTIGEEEMEEEVVYDARKWHSEHTPRREEDQPLDVDRLLAIEKEGEAAIKFKASVWKVGSLGGGGLRVQLNLDQAYIRQMAMLAECQHDPEMELEFEARQSRD